MIAFIGLVPLNAYADHPKHHKNKSYKTKGGPPSWAPAHGYRTKMEQVRHLYYPEQNIYFDTQKEVYIYINMGRWEVSARLPMPLRELRLDQATSIGLEINSETPQIYNVQHRTRYQRTGSGR